MKWTTLSTDAYNRLCNCRSAKKDIVPIAKAYMIERGYDPETAMEIALEHLGANNQFFDLTKDEWTDAINELKGA